MTKEQRVQDTDIAIINGSVFDGDRFIHDRAVWINGNRIVGLFAEYELPEHIQRMDAQGHYVTPGFVDLQVYGAGNWLFSADPAASAMDGIAKTLVNQGTTSFQITMATNTQEVVNSAVEVLQKYRHPALLGLHLEGPYLNPAKRGAHPAGLIRTPEREEIGALLEKAGECLTMMTIAPECFSLETIELLKDRGVLLSAGHSHATFEEAMAGFRSGVVTTTHLFNAMSPFHHRNTGLPGAVFQSEQITASIIADGIHVDYPTLSISKRLLGERLFLITDAVVEVHMGTYVHLFRGDRYTLPDGTLSGSALTMMQAVANCVRHADIPLDEALRMATIYPASVFGATDIGRITTGSRANVIIFDDQFELKHVFFEGQLQ